MSKSDDFIKKYLGTSPASTVKTNPQQTTKSSGGSLADQFISKYNPTIDNGYISGYIADWRNYVKDAETTYNGLSWASATSGNFDRFDDTDRDLSTKSALIRSYVNAHKDAYGEEKYKSIISELDEMDAFRSNFRNGLTEAQKYYSQWATEDDYNSYLEQQKSVPSAVATGPQPQKSRPGRMGIVTSGDLAQTAEAIRNGTYQEPAINIARNRNDGSWFQKPAALDDGFQIKDIPAIVGGTLADVGGNLVEGVGNLAENILDTGYDFVANELNDFLYVVTGDKFMRNYMQRQIRKTTEEDTFGAKETADLYIRDPAQGLLGINVEDSPLGEKSDALVQSAGQLAAQYGLSAVGVPWFVTAGLSSYGAELKNAYAHGATREQAMTSAMIAAGAEILSEQLFAGDLFTGGAGTALATDALSKAISGKALNSFLRYGIDIFGEGFEETFSQFLSKLGSTAYRDENIGQILFSEEALEEYVDSFVGGVALGGAMTGGKVLVAHNSANAQNQTPTNRPIDTQQPSTLEQTVDPPDSLQAPSAAQSLADAVILGDTTQAPQSAPTAENLSGIAQDGNPAIPGAESQETTSTAKSLKYQAAKVNQAILRLIDRVKQGLTAGNERVQLTTVSDKVATKIQELTGTDVRGYEVVIEARQIDHILKDHGENGRTDRSMAKADDIAKMEYALEDPDSIINAGTTRAYVTNKNGKMKPANTVLYEKQNGDGSYYVVQAVPDTNKKTLYIVTAFIGEPGYKKTEASQSTNAYSPGATPEAESVIASNSIVPNTSEVVNPDIASPENSTTSVGAAPAGFDPLTHAMVQYGNIPEGENAVRDDSLPVSMDGESRVSWVARTALGAEATPDAYAEDIRKEVADGNLSYIPITNDATVQKVEKHIREVGWQEAYTEWVANVEKGITGAEMTATGAVLLNNAANAGDHKSWRNILYHFQKLGTNTAQGLQAFRILKTLSPSDKLWMIEKSAQQMVNDLGIDVEIALDQTLVDEYNSAQTDEQREAALDKIIDTIAAQIPATFMEKVNSIRYMNMLGNLRTQFRNLFGNISMSATTSVKNTVATALEHLVHKISGGKIERTKSFAVSRKMMQSGLQDFDNVKSIVNSGGRYSLHDSETSDIKQRIQDKRKIFNFKLAEWYRKGTNRAMDTGDVLFSKPAYARALAGYLKAHGVTDADFSKVDPELMDNARLYAVKQAQEQTFRDTNAISQWVSKIGRRKDTPAAAKILAEGVLPFRKTPANVAVRAWEYSPLGIVNAVVNSVNAARSGSDTTAADAINSWAKTLTGGGLIGLGMLLQSLGRIRGTEDDDEQRSFDSLNGWQEYSLVLPDGTNLTIDALSPAALPLLVGAQMKAVIDGEGFSLDQVLGAISALADPMVDMSLMSGIKSLIEDIRYSEEPLGQIAVNTLIDYATQIVTNSLLGQLERSTEKQRMQTYVDPDSSVPDWIQKALGGISAKWPVWDYQQIPYINAWGEKEENPPFGLNLLENTVSPFYFDKGEKTPLTEELNRLYNDAQETGVYPSRPDKKQTYTDKNGVKHKNYGLNAQEYVEFATVQGQTQKRILDEMISSDAYKSLPDFYKAKAIEEAYWCANRNARYQVLSDQDEEYHKWISRCWSTEAEFILSRMHLRYLTDQVIPESGYKSARQVQIVEQIATTDDGYTERDQEKMLWEALSEAKLKTYNKVKGMGYDIDDFAAVYRIYQEAEDRKDYGKKDAIRDIMLSLNVSESTATALYEAYQKPNG